MKDFDLKEATLWVLFVFCCLYLCSDWANAETPCRQGMYNLFEKFKAAALTRGEPTLLHQIGFTETSLPWNNNGRSNTATLMIEFDDKICQEPEYYRAGVMAHEWGHWISWSDRNLFKEVYDSQNRGMQLAHDETTYEDIANIEAGNLYFLLGLDWVPFINETGKRCTNYGKYYCDRAFWFQVGLSCRGDKECLAIVGGSTLRPRKARLPFREIRVVPAH